MTDSFESILDECISAMQAGVPLDEILTEVPEYADELRPLLFASMLLTDPDPSLAPVQQKEDLRAEYIKQVTELPALPHPGLGARTSTFFRVIRRRLTREAILNDLVTVAITIILTLAMIFILLNVLAVDALPGDTLYPVKRSGETIRLTFTFDPEQADTLSNQFSQERLDEVEQLMAQNRVAVVDFQGILETKGETVWVVEGHPILIPDDLTAPASAQEGDTIAVIGLLRANGVLVADSIIIVN